MTAPRKIKIKLKAIKPRNPLVVTAALRKAGSHRKSEKARRVADNTALKKQVPGT
ncbi:MAG: hypothetical protein ACKVIH_12380 [Burkholderiales bacterium]